MRECYIHPIRSINLIIKEYIVIWAIPRSIEAAEKWALKKEELEKEIKENRSLSEKNIPN